MQGYLASRGVYISGYQLRQSFPIVAPEHHALRQQDVIERTNPHLYNAHYFGHRIHIDQNEKLAMYGLTYVLARDGYSGKIVAGSVMSQKNNLIIYEKIYRTALLEFGLWEQVRVDHGREFYLLLFIQEKLRETRGDPEIAPYRQTSSCDNHIIERMWVELNHRVTYPLKRVLVEMDEQGLINMQSSAMRYCVSEVLKPVAEVGMTRMLRAWNAHSVPHHGIPNVLQDQRNGTLPMHASEILPAEEAVSLYRGQGGVLTDPHTFGEDPLETHFMLKQQRISEFRHSIIPYEDIFSHIISGDNVPFEQAIESYIDITQRLSLFT